MTFDATTVTVFLLAVGLLGLAKGGLSGMGLMSMPMMLLVMPPAAAAGLILPVLMIQDVYSLWLYRGQWDWANLKRLAPAAGVGLVIGFLTFAAVPQKPLLALLGSITLAFALRGLLLPQPPARVPGRPVAWALGMIAGFTSTVLHHGGPPVQMYLIPQRLPREVFVGTTVVFFAVINIVKLPGFVWLGQVTREGLIAAVVAAPFALGMTWVGAALVRRIDNDRFYALIHWLLVAVGLKLLWDGLA